MRLALAALLVLAAGPALAQSGDCRGQAATVERELLMMSPELPALDRFRADRELAYARGLCESDPNRASWEIEKIRRQQTLTEQTRIMPPGGETQLAEQPRFITPGRENLLGQSPRIIVPDRSRWNSGGVDDLGLDGRRDFP